jgi:hypothetical protein
VFNDRRFTVAYVVLVIIALALVGGLAAVRRRRA